MTTSLKLSGLRPSPATLGRSMKCNCWWADERFVWLCWARVLFDYALFEMANWRIVFGAPTKTGGLSRILDFPVLWNLCRLYMYGLFIRTARRSKIENAPNYHDNASCLMPSRIHSRRSSFAILVLTFVYVHEKKNSPPINDNFMCHLYCILIWPD